MLQSVDFSFDLCAYKPKRLGNVSYNKCIEFQSIKTEIDFDSDVFFPRLIIACCACVCVIFEHSLDERERERKKNVNRLQNFEWWLFLLHDNDTLNNNSSIRNDVKHFYHSQTNTYARNQMCPKSVIHYMHTHLPRIQQVRRL